MKVPACYSCGNPEPRDLLVILSRVRPDRPPRYACRAGANPQCLPAVSPGGHAADAIALLVEPSDAERSAFLSAVAPPRLLP